jgi:hypothetical protein
MVTSWLCGFFVKSPCLALNRKTPAEPGCCSDFFKSDREDFFVVFAEDPHFSIGKISPLR